MQAWFQRQWQSYGLAHCLLIPLSWLYGVLSWLRCQLYRHHLLKSYRLTVPVIVVGNIHVGGTGKTPMVIYLIQALKQAGYQPGVISRGYGGKHTGQVSLDSDPAQCGDEPLVIARQTQCPLWVNPDRVAAGQALLSAYPECDVLISDDGLQHYRLQRDIELVMVDSSRQYVNQLLPAGPLREPYSRLKCVDAIIETGSAQSQETHNGNSPPTHAAHFVMRLQVTQINSLDDQRHTLPEVLRQEKIMALAGIGNPQKFFNTVQQLGVNAEQRVFDDHHRYTQQDFADLYGYTLLMTEKDAVKCRHLKLPNAWYVAVTAEVQPMSPAQASQTLLALVQHQLGALKENA